MTQYPGTLRYTDPDVLLAVTDKLVLSKRSSIKQVLLIYIVTLMTLPLGGVP